jgi:uncharacterized protein YkwD
MARVFPSTLLCSAALVLALHAPPALPQMTRAEQAAAQALVADANQDRARHGLGPLRQDPNLTAAAWQHEQVMLRSRGLSHQLPGEPGLTARIQQAGVRCSTVAENLAEAPSPAQINDEWMHSPMHRANLLDPRLNAIGVAVVRRHGELYAVQDFAHELQTLTPMQQEHQVATLLRTRGLSVETRGSRAHAYCNGDPTRTRPLPRLVMRYSTADLSRLPAQVEQGIRSGRFRRADVAACHGSLQNGFAAYQIVLLLY